MGRSAVGLTYPQGATPIDDISDLKIPWVNNLADLTPWLCQKHKPRVVSGGQIRR